MAKYNEWVIQSSKEYEIEGRTDFADHNPDKKCFIIVHGYCGSMYEHMHVAAAQFFCENGYDVIRFNLQSQNYKLRDCTLDTHAHYLNTVLDQLCSPYQKIYISGHSYGGPTVMTAQPKQAQAICLWDPSFNLPALWETMDTHDHNDFTILNFDGNEVLAGKAMVHEGRNKYDTDMCLALSEQLNCPIQVINASEGEEFEVYKIDQKSWHSAGHEKNCRIVIPNSDHNFTKGNTLDQLIEKTYEWFEKF